MILWLPDYIALLFLLWVDYRASLHIWQLYLYFSCPIKLFRVTFPLFHCLSLSVPNSGVCYHTSLLTQVTKYIVIPVIQQDQLVLRQLFSHFHMDDFSSNFPTYRLLCVPVSSCK